MHEAPRPHPLVSPMGGGGPKISKGGGKKFVTGPYLAALGLGDSSLYNSPRHAADKSFEINQLAYHWCSVDSG